jgi:CO/xanthine dehydrogenase FAD-binding subunit
MVTITTVDTLQNAAASNTQGTVFLGGGTLVMRGINYGVQGVSNLVRLRDPRSLATVSNDGGRIRIGACTTMSDVSKSAEVSFLHPVARAVGGPAVRNMATVGGNIFARHPYGDFTVALLALDALVRMSDGSDIELDRLLATRDTESRLVESVSIARPSSGDFRFLKITRVKPIGAALLSMAVWLPRQAGRISGARVAYGAMAMTPVRVPAVENGIARALQVTTQDLSPPDDSLASGWYRSEVAPVHLKRLLLGEGQR